MAQPDLQLHPALAPLLNLTPAQAAQMRSTLTTRVVQFLEQSAAKGIGNSGPQASYITIPPMPEEAAALLGNLSRDFGEQLGPEKAAALMTLLHPALSLHTGDSGKYTRVIQLKVKPGTDNPGFTHMGTITHTIEPLDLSGSDAESVHDDMLVPIRQHAFSFTEAPDVFRPFLQPAPAPVK